MKNKYEKHEPKHHWTICAFQIMAKDFFYFEKINPKWDQIERNDNNLLQC